MGLSRSVNRVDKLETAKMERDESRVISVARAFKCLRISGNNVLNLVREMLLEPRSPERLSMDSASLLKQ